MINIRLTPEQERLRELVERLRSEEMPLSAEDARRLGPFLKIVRTEIVEEERKAYKRYYYMLSDQGVVLHERWKRGELDDLIPVDQGPNLPRAAPARKRN